MAFSGGWLESLVDSSAACWALKASTAFAFSRLSILAIALVSNSLSPRSARVIDEAGEGGAGVITGEGGGNGLACMAESLKDHTYKSFKIKPNNSQTAYSTGTKKQHHASVSG